MTNKNRELVRNARSAAHARMLYETAVAASQDISTTGTDLGKLPERDGILAACCGVWITGTLGLEEGRKGRLVATSEKELDGMVAMVAMARHLVFDCPDEEKYQLGIAHGEYRCGPEGFEKREGTWVCKFDRDWWKAFWAINQVSSDVSIVVGIGVSR